MYNWSIFKVGNGQIMKTIKAIWSHCTFHLSNQNNASFIMSLFAEFSFDGISFFTTSFSSDRMIHPTNAPTKFLLTL